ADRRRGRRHRGQEGDHRDARRRADLRRRDRARTDAPLAPAPAALDPPAVSSHHSHVAGLPSGTVTFLFTDIEGSTRLLQELGDSYAETLAEHRRVLREVFARHHGVEVDTQGDAFFVAFARAAAALEGGEEMQRGMTG